MSQENGKKPAEPPFNGKPAPAAGRREDDLAERLQHLGQRLERKDSEAPKPIGRVAAQGRGMAQALRLASEFIAGILVGAGLGWLADRWLGTSPFGLMIFLLVGFAVGVVNVMRSAGVSSGSGNEPS